MICDQNDFIDLLICFICMLLFITLYLFICDQKVYYIQFYNTID